jgi:hypothetical protein
MLGPEDWLRDLSLRKIYVHITSSLPTAYIPLIMHIAILLFLAWLSNSLRLPKLKTISDHACSIGHHISQSYDYFISWSVCWLDAFPNVRTFYVMCCNFRHTFRWVKCMIRKVKVWRKDISFFYKFTGYKNALHPLFVYRLG